MQDEIVAERDAVSEDSGSAPRRSRRRDPGRKDRIVGAALEVIEDRGVAGTTHRRIADIAGVPLGSVTYYFRSLDELVAQAFARHVAEQRSSFERLFVSVVSREGFVDVLVDLVLTSRSRSRSAVLGFELYLAALRDDGLRVLTRQWTEDSRQVLARFIDREAASGLDDLLEGMILHQLVGELPGGPSEVRAAIERVLGPVVEL